MEFVPEFPVFKKISINNNKISTTRTVPEIQDNVHEELSTADLQSSEVHPPHTQRRLIDDVDRPTVTIRKHPSILLVIKCVSLDGLSTNAITAFSRNLHKNVGGP